MLMFTYKNKADKIIYCICFYIVINNILWPFLNAYYNNIIVWTHKNSLIILKYHTFNKFAILQNYINVYNHINYIPNLIISHNIKKFKYNLFEENNLRVVTF